MMKRTPCSTEAEALKLAQAGLAEYTAKYPSDAATLGFIARADKYDDGFYPTLAAKYVVIERAKKTRPWVKTGEVFGSCQADATDRSGVDSFGPLKRVVVVTEWISIQARQHLNSLSR